MRERRFNAFNDHLRSRFGDRIQRVSLNGTLVCPHPEGAGRCPWCGRGEKPRAPRGFPVHEQIRRSLNFARRHNDRTPRLLVSLGPPGGSCAPLDHIEATLRAIAAQPEVVVISLTAPAACATDALVALLDSHAAPERDVWLDIAGVPGARPSAPGHRVRIGIQVDLGMDGAGNVPEAAVPAPGAGTGQESAASDTETGQEPGTDRPVEVAIALVRRFKPDAVAVLAPVITEGGVPAEALERGEIREPGLDEFAARAARFLEAIPAEVVVHLAVLDRPADAVLGPRWVLNRQKVEEAVATALERQGTRQGARQS